MQFPDKTLPGLIFSQTGQRLILFPNENAPRREQMAQLNPEIVLFLGSSRKVAKQSYYTISK